jgi:hypothetical protein
MRARASIFHVERCRVVSSPSAYMKWHGELASAAIG